MKKTCLLFTFIFFASQIKAQVNLVPNPSFEDTLGCPNNTGETNKAKDWNININTADYYNKCATSFSGVSIPINAWGFQYPSTGNAYAGFYAYIQHFLGSNEYLGTQLITPLIIGQKYFVSFKVSLSDGNSNLMCGIDKVGMLFTNVFFGDTVITPAPFKHNFSQVHSSNIILDTTGWATVSGFFIADSAYSYFMIGNFYDSAHTNIQCLDTSNHSNRWSYYYVDDVCISADSLTCGFIASDINEVTTSSINIYPNPATNYIYFSGNGFSNYECTLFNLLGEDVKKIKGKSEAKINVEDINNGIYILQINCGDKIINQKQIIQH